MVSILRVEILLDKKYTATDWGFSVVTYRALLSLALTAHGSARNVTLEKDRETIKQNRRARIQGAGSPKRANFEQWRPTFSALTTWGVHVLRSPNFFLAEWKQIET